MFKVNGETFSTETEAMRAYAEGGFIGRIEAATPEQKPDMAATKRLADALGVALPDTWFPPETEMLDEGKQTYRAHARRHEEKDPMKGLAISLAMEIEAENRTAFAVDLADLTLKAGAHGETLVSRDGGSKACPLTAHAAGQLLSKAGMGRAAWAFMNTMDAQLRADWSQVVAGTRAAWSPAAGSARSMQRWTSESVHATWNWAIKSARDIQESVTGMIR